jgi:hypothetical protein
MTDAQTKTQLTPDELAHLGEGHVAYMRKMKSDDLKGRFPDLPPIASGLELWTLFAANGEPILLSDERDSVLARAQEDNLVPVSLH